MMLTAPWHMLTMTKTHTKKNTKTNKRENFQEERVKEGIVKLLCVAIYLREGVRRFERFEFLSEKINFTALGGSKSSSFEPDTSHP